MKTTTKKIKLTDILATAEKQREYEHDAGEELKKGNYRAGSTGLYQEGSFYGKCARKLLLRTEGVKSESVTDDRRIMFSGGLMNEEVWLENLKLGSDYTLKTEEEIPTSWFTKTSSTPVTGRPDIVLCDPETENPLLGIELKMVSSVWTARDIIQGNPKFDHLTQASHYMWQLDIPFKLAYTSYVDYAVMGGWMAKLFPKHDDDVGAEYCEYKQNSKGFMDIRKVKPFRIIFDLKWSPLGVLLYKEELDAVYKPTVITLDGVKNYFEELDKVREGNYLPPKPTNVNADGSKTSWSLCDYCSLNSVCSSSKDDDLELWKEQVKLLNENK